MLLHKGVPARLLCLALDVRLEIRILLLKFRYKRLLLRSKLRMARSLFRVFRIGGFRMVQDVRKRAFEARERGRRGAIQTVDDGCETGNQFREHGSNSMRRPGNGQGLPQQSQLSKDSFFRSLLMGFPCLDHVQNGRLIAGRWRKRIGKKLAVVLPCTLCALPLVIPQRAYGLEERGAKQHGAFVMESANVVMLSASGDPTVMGNDFSGSGLNGGPIIAFASPSESPESSEPRNNSPGHNRSHELNYLKPWESRFWVTFFHEPEGQQLLWAIGFAIGLTLHDWYRRKRYGWKGW